MQFSENRTFQRKKFAKKNEDNDHFKLFLLNYGQLEENKYMYVIPKLIAVNF